MVRLDKALQTIILERFNIQLPRSTINRILLARAVKYNGEVIKKKGFKFPNWQEAYKIELDEKIVKALIKEYTTGKIAKEYAQMWNNSAPLNHFEIRKEYIEQAKDITNDILYKDKDYLVIYKPPGVLSHPAQKDNVDNMIYRYLKYIKTAEGFLPRGGLLHRLDKDTHGGMVFATNLLAFNHLKQQFNNNEVIKLYLVAYYAQAPNRLAKKIVSISNSQNLNTFINLLNNITVLNTKDSITTQGAKDTIVFLLSLEHIELNGHIALYRYENKAKFTLNKRELRKKIFRKIKDASSIIYPIHFDKTKNIGLAAVKLITGRTHQIRAQFKFLGLPIINDPIYMPEPLIQKLNKHTPLQNLHLAAFGLSFYPVNSKNRVYVALPKDKIKLPAIDLS